MLYPSRATRKACHLLLTIVAVTINPLERAVKTDLTSVGLIVSLDRQHSTLRDVQFMGFQRRRHADYLCHQGHDLRCSAAQAISLPIWQAPLRLFLECAATL